MIIGFAKVAMTDLWLIIVTPSTRNGAEPNPTSCNHEHDDKHRGGPNRERLENPEKRSHDENANDANFERIQDSHGACGIESEGFVGQEEGGDGKQRRNDEFDEFSLCHNGRKFSNNRGFRLYYYLRTLTI
jgi:hypothetical protein